jgi:hypothetical protein
MFGLLLFARTTASCPRAFRRALGMVKEGIMGDER